MVGCPVPGPGAGTPTETREKVDQITPIAPATGQPRSSGPRARYAAVDLGTNNCRLLVAYPNSAGFRVVDAFSRIVRLGERVDADGVLAQPAMDRTMSALAICASKLARNRVAAVRAVATEACRRAANFPEFRLAVRDRTGLELELITAREEARLSLAGCSPLLTASKPWALMFDIGGGSTEVMWLNLRDGAAAPILVDSVSLPIGVVNLSERFGDELAAGAAMSLRNYTAIAELVIEGLTDLDLRHGISARIAEGSVQMLGSSGTVTTLAGVALGLKRYDRSKVDGTTMPAEAALAVSRRLAAKTREQLAMNPCIGIERADLVVSGCAVLEGLCALWPVPNIRIADRGVREGILMDLMAAAPRPMFG